MRWVLKDMQILVAGLTTPLSIPPAPQHKPQVQIVT